MNDKKRRLLLAAIKLVRQEAERQEPGARDFVAMLFGSVGEAGIAAAFAKMGGERELKNSCREVICDLFIWQILTIESVRGTEIWYRRHSDWEPNLAKLEQALNAENPENPGKPI